MPLGRATDFWGRIREYPGMYVVDGSFEELLNDPAIAATLKQSASGQTAVGGAVPQS